MKKQLLLLSFGFLINTTAYSMDKQNQLISTPATTSSSASNSSIAAAMDSLPQMIDAHKQFVHQLLKNLKEEQEFDPATLLEPFGTKVQITKTSIEECLKHARDFNSTTFNLEHSQLENHTQQLYCQFLAKTKTAKICISSPCFNTLLLSTKRVNYELFRQENLNNYQTLLAETVSGFLQSLMDVKEANNKQS